jgi:hypothetical protein
MQARREGLSSGRGKVLLNGLISFSRPISGVIFEPTVEIGYGDVAVGEVLLESISDVEAVGTVGEGDGD